ncbi:hypothetical protein AMK14_06540 [Streptomyces sp. TSRI0445]|uniref:Secreted protein n=1 Tax=Streptomyces globisporus TaxID=1908 RepID=A0ABN8UXT2_STRGL|nr:MULTISPECIES: hypothetical protein [Streptomyces]PPA40679.1 hypothetical protein BF14_013455 [Streptomyces griseus]RAN18026.1 hypothetical protein A3838_13205 [Streptomyces badius]AWL86837.1 hypothetical protein DIJ69_13440 [Streptomyces globisporus]OKI72918.1 hypothetical protein AMK14_06540 [Streptomyces sp. TSRI0445]RAN25905.1 hypothetical protein A3800_13215 [Streptomyces badius]
MNPTLSRRTASRARGRSLAAACALAAALALTATACSGDGGGTKGGGSASDSKKTKEDQALEHRKCLREQGLDIPEPKPGENGMGVTIDGGSMGKEKMEKAFKACEDKAVGGGPKEMTQAEKDKAVAYARCMRQNGFDMPDPKFDGGAMQAAPALKSKDMKKFEKANKACESAGR